MRPLFRPDPLLPAAAMKTYQILQPVATHYRDASCAEVDCVAQARGWRTTVDVATELGARQANYIRLHSGRHFTTTEAGTLVTFEFPAGQRCFTPHKVPLDRPNIFVVRRGDYRDSTVERRHTRAADWVDDFANHQQRLADRLAQG